MHPSSLRANYWLWLRKRWSIDGELMVKWCLLKIIRYVTIEHLFPKDTHHLKILDVSLLCLIIQGWSSNLGDTRGKTHELVCGKGVAVRGGNCAPTKTTKRSKPTPRVPSHWLSNDQLTCTLGIFWWMSLLHPTGWYGISMGDNRFLKCSWNNLLPATL